MTEIWKPAIYIYTNGKTVDFGFKYEISNMGNLRFTKGYKKDTSLLPYVKPGTAPKRYLVIGASKCKDGIDRGHLLIHRMVLSTFNPEGFKKGWAVDHINNNPHDNRLENLQWLSTVDNVHKQDHVNLENTMVVSPSGQRIPIKGLGLRAIGRFLGFNGKYFATNMVGYGSYKGYRLER